MIHDPVTEGYASRIDLWRSRLFIELGPDCVVCKEKYGRKRRAVHLHEGILWRSEVMGFPPLVRLRVFADCNVFPICSSCHLSPPPREFFFNLACKKYTEQSVRLWYGSLGWRVPPDRRFMPIEDQCSP